MVSLRRNTSEAASAIRAAACPLPAARHYDRILSWIGDASIVLLGESTHGTHDFYAARAALTRRLIEERDFSAVAIEGDWPDAFRVNRYVRHRGNEADLREVLRGFARFPTWMWRNSAVTEFIAWLHDHNARQPAVERRAGFYGLDLYSLHASMRAVVDYLAERDPVAARAARASYGCFDHFGHDPQAYAWATAQLGDASCEEAVARQLVALRAQRHSLLARDGAEAEDDFFQAEQNARVAQNAERYYRTMTSGRVESWNLRDRHMADTLDALLVHLRRRGQSPKIVVWAHNSHVGDARATEIGEQGELTLGQLVRERHGTAARLIGLTTFTGSVIAASEWGGPAEIKRVLPALPGSCEELLHDAGVSRFFLPLTPGGEAAQVLGERRLQRAIGVVYRPEQERWSHYFHARLAQQFDAVIHFDETRAIEPLERVSEWDEAEAPETYPSGV